MAKVVIGDRNLSAETIDRMRAPLELDLVALFRVMEDDILAILEESVEDGATPDQIVARIVGLFEEGPDLP